MENTNQIIQRIKKFHQDNPFDPAHDLAHHEAVTKNAMEIIKGEKLSDKCDSSVVEVSSMIHDLIDEKRGNLEEMTDKAKELIIGSGGSGTFTGAVISVVETHSFGKNQGDSVEAEVLYDADKLEYVSVDRFKLVLAAVQSGEMSVEKLKEYKKIWRERILGVLPSLHFETSRLLFKTRLELVIKYIKTESPEYSDWLDGVI